MKSPDRSWDLAFNYTLAAIWLPLLVAATVLLLAASLLMMPTASGTANIHNYIGALFAEVVRERVRMGDLNMLCEARTFLDRAIRQVESRQE